MLEVIEIPKAIKAKTTANLLNFEKMGEIRTQIKLQNAGHRMMFRKGIISEDEIKTFIMDGTVDTGAIMLALPQDIVEYLELDEVRKVVVRYADELKEERSVCGPIFIELEGRWMITECLVLPPVSEALIGQIVLEATDLLADCANRRLITRPESPIYPLLNLK